MRMNTEDIKRQLDLGEDSYWEFKQVEFRADRPIAPKRDDLADEIAAFANAGGGVLLCGVTDDGAVQGMSREQMNALERMVVELCSHSIRPSLFDVAITRHQLDDKALLAVSVAKGTAQHDSPGGSFRRVGSSKRQMASDERMRLAQQRGQARYRWFDEQPVPDTGFRTLDETLWKPLLSVGGRAGPETALEKLALLGRDEDGAMRATVAGILLCTYAPEQWLPSACITATHYRGEDRASGQLDARIITGPINQQVADAMAFVMRNMRVGAYKKPARLDLPQYSAEALFEAMVNAVAHRDYSIRGSRIRLSMFADRIEINSPGGLANNLTIDSMAARQATRNETIASALGRMPVGDIPGSEKRQFFMERRGDGVPIILRETEALSGKAPTYWILGESDLFLTLPAADTNASPATVAVTVRREGRPVAGADLLGLFPDNTWQRATTDENGEAALDLYATNLPMTVFVAAKGCAAHLAHGWVPADGALAVDLKSLSGGGAVIFPEATGAIPGLKGQLNPIRGPHDRTYLYASNITVNQGEHQPVHFSFGEDLRLMDANGIEMWGRVVHIVGRSALMEYRAIEP